MTIRLPFVSIVLLALALSAAPGLAQTPQFGPMPQFPTTQTGAAPQAATTPRMGLAIQTDMSGLGNPAKPFGGPLGTYLSPEGGFSPAPRSATAGGAPNPWQTMTPWQTVPQSEATGAFGLSPGAASYVQGGWMQAPTPATNPGTVGGVPTNPQLTNSWYQAAPVNQPAGAVSGWTAATPQSAPATSSPAANPYVGLQPTGWGAAPQPATPQPATVGRQPVAGLQPQPVAPAQPGWQTLAPTGQGAAATAQPSSGLWTNPWASAPAGQPLNTNPWVNVGVQGAPTPLQPAGAAPTVAPGAMGWRTMATPQLNPNSMAAPNAAPGGWTPLQPAPQNPLAPNPWITTGGPATTNADAWWQAGTAPTATTQGGVAATVSPFQVAPTVTADAEQSAGN